MNPVNGGNRSADLLSTQQVTTITPTFLPHIQESMDISNEGAFLLSSTQINPIITRTTHNNIF
jgi:hypothetical protein